MKAKHYYMFDKRIQNKFCGNSLNEKNWELLRMDEQESPFSIEKNAEEFRDNCMKSTGYRNATLKIQDLLASIDTEQKKIISLGAGKGILEWHLKNMNPEWNIECTDYTENAIKQLKQVFPEVDAAYAFDMLDGDYSKLDANAVFIMYRVSTEFNIKEWYKIFASMYDAKILHIIFVPTGLYNVHDMIKEKKNHIKHIIKREKDIHCGWLYSEKEYLKMFKGAWGGKVLYTVKDKVYFDGTAAFLLKRNSERM